MAACAAIEPLERRQLLSGVTGSGTAVPTLDSEDQGPVAIIRADDVSTTAGSRTVRVTYFDQDRIDDSSIGLLDISINGPGGPLPVIAYTKDSDRPAGTINATYTFTPPGGSWDLADNGAYTVALIANEVKNRSGAGAVASSKIFNVALSPQVDTDPPAVQISVANVAATGGATHVVNVTYNDDSGIDAASIDASDLAVSGPNGPLAVTGVAVRGSGNSIVATYTVAAPGGSWDFADNGSYTASVQAGSVRDAVGNANVAASQGFSVSIPPADSAGPIASITAANIGQAGGATHTVVVRYLDSGSVARATIDTGDIVVTGPAGAVAVTGVTVNGSDAILTATYTLAAPGGAWDSADNGPYSISLPSGSVTDALGNANSPASGGFNVSIAQADDQAPSASLSAPSITSPGGTVQTVTLVLSDNTAIDTSTIGTGSIVVRRGGGAALSVTHLDLSPAGNAGTVTATFQVLAPGGSWDASDNGTYTILYTGEARDTGGNAAPAVSGNFNVNIAPSDSTAPTATISVSDVTTSGATSGTVSILFTDDIGIDAGSINAGNLIITRSNGRVLRVGNVTVTPAGNGAALTAVYTFDVPGAAWDAGDNGVYTVTLKQDDVRDTSGNRVAGTSATFRVDIGTPDNSAPTARLSVSDVNQELSSYTVAVAYHDDQGLDLDSIGSDDLAISGPAGAIAVAGVSVSGSATDAVANYTLALPGGSFEFGDNGTYTVQLIPSALRDAAGNAVAGESAAFTVNIPRSDGNAPVVAAISAPGIVLAGGNSQTVVVSYSDDLGIDDSSIGDNDISVSGLSVSNVSVHRSGTAVTVTYTLTPPGGAWDYTDNGTYTVTVNAGQVRDVSGKGVASASATFSVSIQDPGPSDPGFAGGNTVTAKFVAEAITTQPDGKIIVAGRQGRQADGSSQAVLQRFNPDGSADSTFGSSGAMVVTSAGSNDAYYAVIVTADGILAAGSLGGDFVVARYSFSGQLDTAFGDGGRKLIDFGTAADVAYAIAVGPGGQIVVGGTADGNFAFTRLEASGARDNTFAQAGSQLFDMGSATDQIGAIAVQADGRMVAAGSSGANTVVLRLRADGEADPTFSGDGVLIIPGLAARNDSARPDHSMSLAIQPDNRILVANKTPGGDFGLTRIDSSGNVDSAFGVNGIASADFGGDDDADAVLLQTTGQILVVGTTDAGGVPKTGIAAFDSQGRPITAFGTGGHITLELGASSPARELHVGDLVLRAFGTRQSDGRLVIGTSDQSPVPTSSALRRLIVPGSSAQPQGSMIGAFGLVDGKKTSLTFTDSDGTVVTIMLKGGSGTAFSAGDKVRLVIDSAGGALTLKGKGGDGRVNLSDISVTGSLKTLAGKTTDLFGTLCTTGTLGKLTLGRVNGTIAAAGGMIAALAADSLSQAYILSGANLGSDMKLGGSDADADSFGPGAIGTIKVRGAVTSSVIGAGLNPTDGVFLDDDDVVMGGTASYIKTIAAKGGADDASRFVAGAVKSAAVPKKLKSLSDDARFRIM